MSKHNLHDLSGEQVAQNNVDLDDVNEIVTEKEVTPEKVDVAPVPEVRESAPVEKPTRLVIRGIINKQCNIRKEASPDSIILSVAKANTEVKILNHGIPVSGFYRIKINNVIGYVRSDLCNKR